MRFILQNKKHKLYLKVLAVSALLVSILLIVSPLFNKKSKVAAKPMPVSLSVEQKKLLSSKGPDIKKLVEICDSNPDVVNILTNLDKYPKELLHLASKNNETIDFVNDYPNYTKNSEKVIAINEFENNNIPLFIQWDKRWGYEKYGEEFIALDGCAPTSLAMVINGLSKKQKVTPKMVAEYAYENGYYVHNVGSKWDLISDGARHFGLKSEEIPLSKKHILSALKNKNPIIVTVKPGTFTTTGHFMVLTGVTKDGKIKLNDPNSKINSSKEWDLDVFIRETKNLWKISN